LKKLYIGNLLPYQATEADLQNRFGEAGISVDTVTLMRDRHTGEARGFGFVEMPDPEADRAVQAGNGEDFMSRNLVVNEARPLREGGGSGRGRGGR
jgi:RNA recognition motif-containing protein